MLRVPLVLGASAVLGACAAVLAIDDVGYPSGASGADAAAGFSDGAVDAGRADAPFSCARVDAGFCDDFEREGGVQGKWTRTRQYGGGILEVIDGGAHGGVLRVAGCGAGECAAALARTFLGAPSAIRYAFDVQLTPPQTDGTLFCGVDVGLPEGPTSIVDFFHTTGGLSLFHQRNLPDGGTDMSDGDPLTQSIVPGTWTHVELALTLTHPPSVTARFDGVTVGQVSLPASFVPGPLAVLAGITYSKDVSDAVLLIDNVVIDETP